MILIIGSNHDDVLYYESLLSNPKELTILTRYHALSGTISAQEVMVIQDVYTSFVSATLVSHIISQYYISVVISVGRCELIKGSPRVGDVVFSESVLFGDVDQIAAVKGTELGQIPGFPRIYPTSLELINNTKKCLNNIGSGKYYSATFISSSFFRQNKERVYDLTHDEYIQSLNQNVVLDGESAGVALACYLHDVPCISIKLVEAKAGEYTTLDNYLLVLKQSATVGKAVAAFIGEISRTDIIRS